MIESSGCLGKPNCFLTQAYLMPIVNPNIAAEFAWKETLIRPPERDPSCKPNLLSAFKIEVLYH